MDSWIDGIFGGIPSSAVAEPLSSAMVEARRRCWNNMVKSERKRSVDCPDNERLML